MSFHIFTYSDGLHFRHENDPCGVTILNDAMEPISATFSSDDDEFDSAVSLKANRFAMGFWSSELAVFDLKSGELQRKFPFKKVAPLATFDEAGSRLLFQTGSQVVLLDIDTAEAVQIKGVRALDRLIAFPQTDEVVVPSQKKGELLCVSLKTGDVSVISLPFDETLFDLVQSPVASQLMMIDRKKSVHLVDMSNWSIIWSVSLKKVLGKDHMGVGQFSGDGSLFGATIAALDHNYTIVLDTNNGEQINRFEATSEGIPFRKTLMRSDTTHEDSFTADTLDLATGETASVELSDL